jgi:two-component system copper resistance phosphate regulon response regulator CusR
MWKLWECGPPHYAPRSESLMNARLLVFDCHEAWVYQLRALDQAMDVVVGLRGRHVDGWDETVRPVPPNARLIRLDEALANISPLSSALCTKQCTEMGANECTPLFCEMPSVEFNFLTFAYESEQPARKATGTNIRRQTIVVLVSLPAVLGSGLDSKRMQMGGVVRVLMVEDDSILAQFVCRRLQNDGLEVEIASDSAEGRRLLGVHTYELMILDLGLERAGGMEVLHQVRATKPSLLTLVLSGSSAVEERIRCLEAGADDFMMKPFSMAELSARIRALFRRINGPTKAVLKVEDLELDRIERTVRRAGYAIELSHKEFALLDFLMQHPLQPVSRNVIVEQAWKLSSDSMTNVVDVYINYLRKKIDSGFDRPLIHTIRGVGYQIGGG